MNYDPKILEEPVAFTCDSINIIIKDLDYVIDHINKSIRYDSPIDADLVIREVENTSAFLDSTLRDANWKLRTWGRDLSETIRDIEKDNENLRKENEQLKKIIKNLENKHVLLD